MPYPVTYLRATATVPGEKVEAHNDSKTFPEPQTPPRKAVSQTSNTNTSESKNSSWSFSPRKTLRKKAKVSRDLNESFNQAEDNKNDTPYISSAQRAGIRCLLSCAKPDYDSPGEDYYAWVPRPRTISLKKAEDQEHKLRRMRGFCQLRPERTANLVSPRKWTIRRVDVTDEESEDEDEEKVEDEQGRSENGDDEQETFWDVSESLSSRKSEPRSRRNAFDASGQENHGLLFAHEGGDARDFADENDEEDDNDNDDPFLSNPCLLPEIDSKIDSGPKRPSFRLATNCGGRSRSSHPRPLTPVEEEDETETETATESDDQYSESAEICTVERQEVRVLRLSSEARAELKRLRGESDEEEEKAAEAVEEEHDEWRVGSIWE
ncbi:hypothetical protein BST61_g5781 [Cercospora zeina]